MTFYEKNVILMKYNNVFFYLTFPCYRFLPIFEKLLDFYNISDFFRGRLTPPFLYFLDFNKYH